MASPYSRRGRPRPQKCKNARPTPRCVVSRAYWQVADAKPRVLDGHNTALLEFRAQFAQASGQALTDALVAGVAQPEHNDAHLGPTGQSHDFPEIQVEREQDPVLHRRLGKYLPVRKALQPFVEQMDRIVALFLQPAHHGTGDAHIGEETHG